MKLKDAVHKIVVPELSKIGFVLDYSHPRHYSFRNDCTGIKVLITVPPRCPMEFIHEYMINDTQKAQGDPEVKRNSFVVFGYSAKIPENGYVNLAPHMFEKVMNIKGGFVYCNSKELEEKMTQIINETRSVVIPYIEKLSKRYVGADVLDKLTEMLASQNKELSQEVMKKFKLPNDYSLGYKIIEPILLELRGDDEKNWKSNFYQNSENVVGLASYLAECISAYAKSTKWFWEITPEIQTCDGVAESTRELYLEVKYANHRGGDFNLLEIIRNLWNFYPYVKCKHIESIIDEIKSENIEI